MAIITVKYPGRCRACGTTIDAGTQAKYIASTLTCIGCKSPARGRKPAGYYASRRDPGGLYSYDGRLIGRVSCGCIDYPCCGH
jgi:hypothetical protein